IAWNLQDTQIQDWYINNNKWLNELSFANFIAKVCNCWLPCDWAENVVIDTGLSPLLQMGGQNPKSKI
ncbi:hypothetical protein BS17DRAFT_691775, partial [Gyrodon lividus]